jgi:hypothetical protein
MRTLFPGARLGNCLRHAINKLPEKLTAIASPVRKALRSQFHTLLHRARQRKGVGCLYWATGYAVLQITSLPWRGRPTARVRQWFCDKKAGWYAVLEDPSVPVTSTLRDQAHKRYESNFSASSSCSTPDRHQK